MKEDWNEQKAKLKARFKVLTDTDLQYVQGKKDEMFEKIQTILGKTKSELKEIIAAL